MSAPAWSIQRLPGNPIIRPHMGARIGENIQGPSLIRVPDWIRAPLGRYYLYFADHKGDHIRLAYANHIAGPWTIHEPGALSLEQSRFPTETIARPEPAPPAVQRVDWAPAGTPGVPSREDDATLPHIASPDVHVDHEKQQILMYYHGLASYGIQRTRVASSADGLNFVAHEPLLGPSYFRVFKHGGSFYALTMPGVFYRASSALGPFEKGPDAFDDRQMRHSAVLVRGNTLWVFWSRVGDTPESILLSSIPLSDDWQEWRASAPTELLRGETAWEGADLPLEPSWRSAITRPVNQLRDPAVFEEGGALYLLYAVKGEAGIAVASMAALP